MNYLTNDMNYFCLVLEYEQLHLKNLPNIECYEKSYMHRDVITHIVVTKYVIV